MLERNPKSLLVIGCGYLGMRVLRLAAQAGWNVYGTSRKPEKKVEIESAGAHFIHFDLTSPKTATNLPPVSHWLWSPAFDRTQGLPVKDVVVDGLFQTLNHAPTKPSSLVFISTTGVYHQSAGEIVDESSKTIPQTESGKSHLQAENLLANWANLNNSNATTLRLSGLYGPGRWIRRKSIENGEPIACDPASWLNLLHIDDAASACMSVLNQELTDTLDHFQLFCVTDDRPVTRAEFYETSATLLQATQPRFVSPETADFSGNKKVVNFLFKKKFQWEPLFSDIKSGLPACI